MGGLHPDLRVRDVRVPEAVAGPGVLLVSAAHGPHEVLGDLVVAVTAAADLHRITQMNR